MVTGSNRGHPSCTTDCNRDRTIRGCAIPKLPVSVVTPRHHCPIHLHRQAMVGTSRHTNGITHPDGLHCHVAVVGGVVAKLAVAVITPVPHGPISFQRHAMNVPSRYRHYPS